MQAVNHLRTVSVQALALQVQDEAYTFAYYLLGDESAAEAATQAAFSGIASRKPLQADRFRREVLRGVLIGSRKVTAAAPSAAREDLTRALLRLPAAERSALVLVDVLGMNYDAAASIMDCSRKQFIHLLAQGRMKFSPADRVQ